ncbi:hypothetical protein MTO96_034636 [Rhipicephalus appendiculatus]
MKCVVQGGGLNDSATSTSSLFWTLVRLGRRLCSRDKPFRDRAFSWLTGLTRDDCTSFDSTFHTKFNTLYSRAPNSCCTEDGTTTVPYQQAPPNKA